MVSVHGSHKLRLRIFRSVGRYFLQKFVRTPVVRLEVMDQAKLEYRRLVLGMQSNRVLKQLYASLRISSRDSPDIGLECAPRNGRARGVVRLRQDGTRKQFLR